MTTEHKKISSTGGTVRNYLLFSGLFVLLCGVIYPVTATLLAGAVFPSNATGSVIMNGDKPTASSLVAQPFLSDHYFYARPSAADYDPTGLGGSNLSPTNPDLRTRAAETSATIQRREGVEISEIPEDMISASGSGIDPHISPKGAEIQIERVARARGTEPSEVAALVQELTEQPTLGVLGKPRVNTIVLNVALDQKWPVQPKL